MKLSEAVAHQLNHTGVFGGLNVGRDERGIFIRYDVMEIDIPAGIVRFKSDDTVVGTETVGRLDQNGMTTLTIKGLEARVRVTIG